MEIIESTALNIPIPSEILWILLAFALVVFLTMLFIFKHHWNYYGVVGNQRVFAKPFFIIISIFLIIAMTLSVLILETL